MSEENKSQKNQTVSGSLTVYEIGVDTGRVGKGKDNEDKPRIRWSAIETVGIGIDNPERVVRTEDGKTFLLPTDCLPIVECVPQILKTIRMATEVLNSLEEEKE